MAAVKRVCLLTGASGPLGTAFIERYADRFDILAVHHRNPVAFATQDQRFVDPLAPARALPQNGHPVHAIRADLAQLGGVAGVVCEAQERFGRVDLLVNAAAVRRFAPLLSDVADPALATTFFAVNVLAPLRLCVELARVLWRTDPEANVTCNRNVINVGSTAGLFVYPDCGQALYASSKAALHHLTYHLASELWNIGVRVNALAPDTFPGRVGTAEVLDAIIDLDESTRTGELLELWRRS